MTSTAAGRTDHIGDALAILDQIDGLPFGQVNKALDALNTKLLQAQGERENLLQFLKSAIDARLNDHLCEMKPDTDDSITGFNEAWSVIDQAFKDRAAAKPTGAA